MTTELMNCYFCKGKKENSAVIYEDDFTYAVLDEGQDQRGYVLLILKQHRDTLFDANISAYELMAFWRAAQKIGNAQKKTLGAENVYAVTLCDGLRHFHVHLVPRYVWSDKDKERYRELFTERDGEESVNACIDKGLIGGFWYLADGERYYKETEFWKLSEGDKKNHLDYLTMLLKSAII